MCAQRRSGSVTKNYQYPADSNRLLGIEQNGVSQRAFTYDAAGNIRSDTRGGTVYTYVYNDNGRLRQSRTNGLAVANYRYDLFERLTPALLQLGLTVGRRTGDHKSGLAVPPHVLLTTPESFDSLLCRGR